MTISVGAVLATGGEFVVGKDLVKADARVKETGSDEDTGRAGVIFLHQHFVLLLLLVAVLGGKEEERIAQVGWKYILSDVL
ncbi:hypothetical protein V5O48_004033 [Marasmius crinis-equi]|uniref:Uncharacterized protein n=1 Tax=Marasmius crinis-equi TaxID=585013 RepID=A0ABR3FRG1_9AGAR